MAGGFRSALVVTHSRATAVREGAMKHELFALERVDGAVRWDINESTRAAALAECSQRGGTAAAAAAGCTFGGV